MGKFNTSLPTASLLIPSAAAPTSAEHITLAIAAILFEVDPCLINFGENTGEYIVEAGFISSQLKRCPCVIQLKTIVDETLNRYFSKNWGYSTETLRSPSCWLQW